MASLHDLLNRQIANFSVLYVKLHHYHWYVKGASFYTLHAKFEELYNEAAGYVDELAERLLALNGRPVSRMAEYLKLATVKEASGTEDADAMVLAIAEDFRKIAAELDEDPRRRARRRHVDGRSVDRHPDDSGQARLDAASLRGPDRRSAAGARIRSV